MCKKCQCLSTVPKIRASAETLFKILVVPKAGGAVCLHASWHPQAFALECRACNNPITGEGGACHLLIPIVATLQIDAEKSPYLTEKLKVWMLPTLALIKNEKVVDYVVGLDDMGGRDDFKTEVLASRLAAGGVLSLQQGDRVAMSAGPQQSVRKGEYMTAKRSDDEDSDFD